MPLPKGFKHSKETKKAISNSHKGKLASEETKKKKSNSMKRFYENGGINPMQGRHLVPWNKGLKNWGKKYNNVGFQKGHKINFGKKYSEERRKNISDALKGREISLKWKEKLSNSHLGHKQPNEVREKIRTFQINNPNKKFKNTSIELKIENELKERGIVYIPQVSLCNIAIVDFLLPDLNTVIQCDGCYWHGCPLHFPNNNKRKERDNFQDKILSLSGYKVYRFWGHEINKSVKECIDKINLF